MYVVSISHRVIGIVLTSAHIYCTLLQHKMSDGVSRPAGIRSFWTYMLELTTVISKVTVAETRSFLPQRGLSDEHLSVRLSVCQTREL